MEQGSTGAPPAPQPAPRGRQRKIQRPRGMQPESRRVTPSSPPLSTSDPTSLTMVWPVRWQTG